MGNRKQPFGYRVVMGEIALHPQESKLVEYIFQQYLAGATYNTLVEELREQSIPYDEGKLWNKNMVARILEDSRYTGERGYPPVIDREALEKALEKRSAKQTAAPKTDTQKLLRRFSGRPSTARMERQVLDLLNGLIISPEQLRLPATAPPDRSTELNLQRELNRVMECQPIDEDAAKALLPQLTNAGRGTAPEGNPRRNQLRHEPKEYADPADHLCYGDGAGSGSRREHESCRY